MSRVRDSSTSVPGRRGGGGERTARTPVPVARPRRRNIAAETQRGRRRRGGGSGLEECGCACGAPGVVLGAVLGGDCWSLSSRDEVEKLWE